MIKYILFFSLQILTHILPTAHAQSTNHKLVEEVLMAARQQNESKVLELKSRVELLPKPERGNRREARSLNERGLLGIKSGNHQSAIEDLLQASNTDPADPELKNNLAYALIAAGRSAEAINPLFAALAISPGRSPAWFNLGEALIDTGDHENAVAAWRLAYLFSSNRDRTVEFLNKLASKSNSTDLTKRVVAEVITKPMFDAPAATSAEIEKSLSTPVNIQTPSDTTVANTITSEASAITPIDTSSARSTGETSAQLPSTTNSASDHTKPTNSNSAEVNSVHLTESTQSAPTWSERIFKLAAIGAIVAFIALIVGGMTNRVVIFYDWSDFLQTLLIFFSLLIGGAIAELFFKEDQLMRTASYTIGCLSALFFSWRTMITSIRNNSSLGLGMIVGIFKILISLILALLALGKLGEITDKSSSLGTKLFGLIFLGILWYFTNLLINGERVHARRAGCSN